MTIAYQAGIIYRYFGGDKVYDSELEVAQELTKYLYACGKSMQNLLKFSAEVARESRSVITGTVNQKWTFYTPSTSLRTNLALQVQSLMKGWAATIDTTGDNPVTSAAKDIINEMSDNLDTTNRIADITTEIQKDIHEKLSAAVSNAANSVLKTAVNLGKWIVKMAIKP